MLNMKDLVFKKKLAKKLVNQYVGPYTIDKVISTNIVKLVRHGSHQGWKSARWTWTCVDLWNDLGFSLCAAPSVYRMVATSDDREKSKREVSTDLVCHCWTPEIEFNKRLSLSIIRLVNYSVTTSLIYESLL